MEAIVAGAASSRTGSQTDRIWPMSCGRVADRSISGRERSVLATATSSISTEGHFADQTGYPHRQIRKVLCELRGPAENSGMSSLYR